MRRLLFWGGITSLAYTLIGFPLVALARGALRRREPTAGAITPQVSIIVSAHNEEAALATKLDSLLGLDYPADRSEILVASDGSTDGTNEIAQGYEPHGVRLLSLPRLGKAAALNAAVAQASGDVLVFSDANSLFAPQTLRGLVAPFADPQVGGVAGDQRYLPGTSATGERRYWDLDRMLKLAESRAGHVISATGAIYAIRRELFQPVPDSVTDDFFVSTGVIEQGYRLVFAPEAVAYEPVADSAGVEFGRKVRIMTRGFRAVLARRALLDARRHGFYSLQLMSHKVLRRLLALPLIAIAAASASLWRTGVFYRLATLAQVGFYVAAVIGVVNRDRPFGQRPIVALPAFFCLANAAALIAAVNVLRGKRIDRWEPARGSGQGPFAHDHVEVEEPESLDMELLKRALHRVRGNRNLAPEASIVVPVNAQGDFGNLMRLLADVAAYEGVHRLEVIAVVNNFDSTHEPAEVELLRDLGLVVVAVSSVRRPGYAVPLMARWHGLKAATSDAVILFDADCRVGRPTKLINWYIEQLVTVGVAYTRVDFYDLPPHASIAVRRLVHHAARSFKRMVLRIPTTRGSNYAVRRTTMLALFDTDTIADDMNVGPAFKSAGAGVAYRGDADLTVLTSGRMFVGSWRRLFSYLRYRIRYNVRVLPVRSDAARRTGKDNDPVRRYVHNRPVR